MSKISYYAYEDAISSGNALDGASDFEVIHFFHEKLTAICVSALAHGEKTVISDIANSRDDLMSFLDDMSTNYNTEMYPPVAASSIIGNLARTLIKRRITIDGKAFDISDDDIAFVLSAFDEFTTAASFAINLQVFKFGFDNLLEAPKLNHPAIFSKSNWPDDKLAALYALGLPLDSTPGSAANHKDFNRALLSCPILNGANKAFKLCQDNLKVNSVIVDELISECYGNNTLPRIIEALTPLHFSFADPDGEEVYESGDAYNQLDSSYKALVQELANEARYLTTDKLLAGYGGNSESISNHRLSIDCLNSVDEVVAYLAENFHGKERYHSNFSEITHTHKRVADVINDLVVESHALLMSMEKIDLLAQSMTNANERLAFLKHVANLFALKADRENVFDDEYIAKPNYHSAFSTYPFKGLTQMVVSLIKETPTTLNLQLGIFELLRELPTPVICKAILKLEDDTTFGFHTKMLHGTLQRDDFAPATKHATDHLCQSLISLYAEAERRRPGFGKKKVVTDIHPQYGLDKDTLMTAYLEKMNADKFTSLDVTSEQQSDMSFLGNELRI